MLSHVMETNSMQQSPRKANSHSASQEILHLLWNLKVHYHVHKALVMGRCKIQ